MTTVLLRRVMSPAEATEMIGTEVGAGGVLLPSPTPTHPVTVVDDDTSEVIAILTRLPRPRVAQLRAAVLGINDFGRVARIRRSTDETTRLGSLDTRTFGYAPKQVMQSREGCHDTTLSRDYPGAAAELALLGGELADQFGELLPARAESDRKVVREQVGDDWFLNDKSLWTSGIINRTGTLPFHRDGANFPTWSAMPSLRFGVSGGRLRFPEYASAFPVGDGDVTWFCGKDLVHGVTPITVTRPGGYRFSIVYYALRGLVNCRTYAEETRLARVRRTERERRMASEL